MKLILASASPRRRELLAAMGIDCEVRSSGLDESTITADYPKTFALRAAYAKARAAASQCEEGRWILAADTVVTRDSVIYGKPRDEAEARRMLRSLSGVPHDVITGVAIAEAGSMKTFLDAERTRVVFRELATEDIDRYIETGEPFDKAGGYGIQGQGGNLVDHIEGDYFNVVGLPCGMLLGLLDDAGIEHGGMPPTMPDRWRR